MRAAIFIDGAHLLKQIGDARVTPDYGRLVDYFLAPLRRNIPLDLLRCYFYYCPPWMSTTPTEEELRRRANWDRFMAELEDLDRWQVRLGKLERRRDGDKDIFSQKRVDVLLSVDMVGHAAAGHIQHAVLVAGDSDFIPAVEAVKESGATLTLWAATDRSAHLDLIHAADEVQYLRWNNFPQKSKEASRHAPPAPEMGRAQRAGHASAKGPPSQAQAPAAAPAAPAAAVIAPLVAIEGGGEGQAGGKKKRRGRRGGRGRNKNRGLSIANADGMPAVDAIGRDVLDDRSSQPIATQEPAAIAPRRPIDEPLRERSEAAIVAKASDSKGAARQRPGDQRAAIQPLREEVDSAVKKPPARRSAPAAAKGRVAKATVEEPVEAGDDAGNRKLKPKARRPRAKKT